MLVRLSLDVPKTFSPHSMTSPSADSADDNMIMDVVVVSSGRLHLTNTRREESKSQSNSVIEI